ncbi:MAG: sulfur carrier protein ThiS [Spirochaetes bacterium]|nr:sulfur carrier protein ThiS [Spirochaetota bacterium]MBU0953841.1 sulfur carrier protein ThiS [Spirochaetota bacterium]
MTILLNNNQEDFAAPEQGLSVSELLAAKGWTFPLIIVRVNGTLVKREDWSSCRVVEGDEVEALHLVSGG